MSDAINNNEAFFANTPAWHRLGKVFPNGIDNIQEAADIAAPWPYIKTITQAVMAEKNEAGEWVPTLDEKGNRVTKDLKDNFAIIRGDGLEIGKVGKDFELIQPRQIVAPFQKWVDQKLITLEAGGTLSEGKRFWMLGKITGAKADVISGDTIEGFVLIYTGFDGSLSVGLMKTKIRVVCQNTLDAAISAGKNAIRIRHTKNLETRFEVATNVISEALEGFQADVVKYRTLAKKRLTRSQQEQYIRAVIAPNKLDAAGNVMEVAAQTETKIRTVINLLDTQRGLELVPAMRGTAWQAYNAVSEYVTHHHGRNDDSRVMGQWFGESAKLNHQALELAAGL